MARIFEEEQREYLEFIERNVKQLLSMTGDFLEFARADGDKLIYLLYL